MLGRRHLPDASVDSFCYLKANRKRKQNPESLLVDGHPSELSPSSQVVPLHTCLSPAAPLKEGLIITKLENRVGPAPQLPPSGTHVPSPNLPRHFHILGPVPSGTVGAVAAARVSQGPGSLWAAVRGTELAQTKSVISGFVSRTSCPPLALAAWVGLGPRCLLWCLTTGE